MSIRWTNHQKYDVVKKIQLFEIMKKITLTALVQMGLAVILVYVVGGFLAPKDPAIRYTVILPLLLLVALVGDGIRFYFSQELELPDTDHKTPIEVPEENRLDHKQYSLINLSGLMGFVMWSSEWLLQFCINQPLIWQVTITLTANSVLLVLLVHPKTAVFLTTTTRIREGAVAVIYRGGKRLNVTVSEGIVVSSRINLFLAWHPGRSIKVTNDIRTFQIEATTGDGVPFMASVTTVVDRSPDFLPWIIAQGGLADDQLDEETGGLTELLQLERNALNNFLIPYFAQSAATMLSEDGKQLSLTPGVINGGSLTYGMLKDVATSAPQATLQPDGIKIYGGASTLTLPITLTAATGKAVDHHKSLLNKVYQKTLEIATENQDFRQLMSHDTDEFRERYGALASWFIANAMGYNAGPMPAILGVASEIRGGLSDIAPLILPYLLKEFGQGQSKLLAQVEEGKDPSSVAAPPDA